MQNIARRGYHLISNSPWPVLGAFWTIVIFFRILELFHLKSYYICPTLYFCHLWQSFGGLLLVIYGWWRDVSREGVFMGYHTTITQKILRCGVFLFILREAIFFFSFFWAFFHRSLSVSPFIGNVWPPKGIPLIEIYGWPLLGTVILLTSRCAATYCHREVRRPSLVSNWGLWEKTKHQIWKSYWKNIFFGYKGELETLLRTRKEKISISIILKLQGKNFKFYTTYFYTILKFIFYLLFINNFVNFLYQIFPQLSFLSYVTDSSSDVCFKCLTLITCFLFFLAKVCNALSRETVGGRLTLILVRWSSYITANRALLTTWVIGVIFLFLQSFEYTHAWFNINTSVYGSIFYVATGFHGLHVFIGVIFLFVQWRRIKRGHFSKTCHVGLEASIWYWHFVDVVWVGLYGGVYCWGNWTP